MIFNFFYISFKKFSSFLHGPTKGKTEGKMLMKEVYTVRHMNILYCTCS